MAIQVVTVAGDGVALSNSVRTQYIENYLEALMVERLYDQFAVPIGRPMSQMKRGSSIQVEFLSDMQPGTTAISEVTDITPQTLVDAIASITPTSRGEALQASELLLIQVFTDYHKKMVKRVGKNMIETVDLLAQFAALQGSNVWRQSAASRAVLNAGTTGDRADDVTFMRASGRLSSLKIPGYQDPINGQSSWAAVMHPLVFHDILQSGNVTPIAQYQNQAILFNHELGSLSGFRFIVSAWAKVFGAAGADNGQSVDTTISTAASALDTTINVANTSSIENGEWLWLGTEETGDTFQTLNERVQFLSASDATITILGEGANGGLRFDHPSGTTLRNADSAYPVLFAGPDSIVKVFATEVGEYGQIIPARRTGTLDQFESVAWKWYGNYGRIKETGLLRLEVAVSAEA